MTRISQAFTLSAIALVLLLAPTSIGLAQDQFRNLKPETGPLNFNDDDLFTKDASTDLEDLTGTNCPEIQLSIRVTGQRINLDMIKGKLNKDEVITKKGMAVSVGENGCRVNLKLDASPKPSP